MLGLGGDALAIGGVEQVHVFGVEGELELLATGSDAVDSWEGGGEGGVAEAAVQQGVGAQRFGLLDAHGEFAVLVGADVFGAQAERDFAVGGGNGAEAGTFVD